MNLFVHIPLNKMESLKENIIIFLETAQSMLLSNTVPSKFQAKSIFTSVYLINHMLSSFLSEVSAFQCLFHTSPDYSQVVLHQKNCKDQVICKANCVFFIFQDMALIKGT